ncbi:alpha/beta fold hydrolase [Alteromonas halophila]|nr:alpha/beta hydrolase [Alteromonas halophila]
MRYLLTLCVACFISAVHANSTVPAFDKRLSGYAYPFEVDAMQFSSQGQQLTMNYMFLPPEDAKPVITLLHGKNFNGAYFERIASQLHQRGYGVLMPDQIGFGKSSKPVDYQYSFAALASHTKQLLRTLDISKTLLVGHSMGGMLASRFALLYPDTVSKLVLVNPIGLENYLHYVKYKDVQFFYENERKKTPQAIADYQRKNYYAGNWNDTYQALAAPLQGWVKGDDWPLLARVSALTYDMIFTQPVIDEFDALSMPVSLILGTRDTTGPGRNWKKEGVTYTLGEYDKLGERVKQRNAAINVHELDDLGHLPFIEDFSRFMPVFMTALTDKPAEE